MRQARAVVPAERLRDQVYRLIREDLTSGFLQPAQRIVEGELAARYGVSRTPVREALMQLARDELVTEVADHRYSVRVDTDAACAERHAVRQLIDPLMARGAAMQADARQKRALARLHARQREAHEAGAVDRFVAANAEFRALLRAMCGNDFLARCCGFADDQAQWERRTAFDRTDYRALELDFDERLTQAVLAGDGCAAESVMRDYVESTRQAH
jgi:DNA-binding GntR family transcriptional regulator